MRLKEDPTKVIVINRKDYYSNKNLYINPGAYRSIKTSEKSTSLDNKEIKSRDIDGYSKSGRPIYNDKRKNRYVRKIKSSDNDTFYNKYYLFVNKNTLEMKKFHYSEKPKEPYDIWFPIIFLDKNNNLFITKELLDKNLKKISNRRLLAKNMGISVKSLKSIIKYYESVYNIEYSNSYTESKSKRFSGKLKITNGTENKVIEEIEFREYEKMGRFRGWITKKLPPKEEVLNFYSEGNNIRDCEKYFHTSRKYILLMLDIDLNSKFKTFNRNGKVIRLRVNSKIEDLLIKNGWYRGRKP